ncbi:MAG TPA: tubulin-like doman-containing protein [Gemmata sp.]|nr:tubulin-like doman-containing protein [Gemmata sp.]
MSVRLVSGEDLPDPLGGYRLIERLGRGGFGEVWKVQAPGGLHKAAKFVFGDLDAMDEESRPAEQELKALNRVREIRHPYILSLERFEPIDGQLIIVMELADRNLWDRFRECRGQGLPGIPRDELLRYMEESAEALDLMNTTFSIQHLDVKPQNLFLIQNHVKVGDFGLAKLLEGAKASVTGGVTPVYAAPETFEGWVSRFSDQYSLAIVFQELLTGTRPFNGSNTRQLLMQHLNSMPDVSSLPAEDQPIIARALSKKPDDRWPSCAAMISALKTSALPRPPAETPPPAGGNRRSSSQGFPSTRPPSGADCPPEMDSVQVTRVAGSTSSRALAEPPGLPARTRTPPPGGLPPLIKPSGPTSAPSGSPLLPTGAGSRLVTPAATNLPSPAQTLNRPPIFQTGRMGSLGVAPPERSGDGTLFPALIVAVGQTGKRVVERLKKLLRERYGDPDRVPNIRILHIDTDPETPPAAPGESQARLTTRETVLARLNRPGHYLQRESLPPVDAWMPTGTLYKLARTPGSAGGVRSLGRLALFDNYRVIAQRVRQEIETFLTDNPLADAARHTKLLLRTNRPRAYVVTELAGGTGGGMFLDLAYLIRHELRQVGYLRPEVVGMFFLPPADRASARSVALGNTFAALLELRQYQSRTTRYQTVFDKSEAPVVDSEAPFSRISMMTLPRTPEAKAQQACAERAARLLFQEMLTPVGRVADETRKKFMGDNPPTEVVCQSIGMFRLSWPRPEMLEAATRRFAQRQIQRWTAKEAAHLREPIAAWLAQQWDDRGLGFEAMVEALQGAVREVLREDPDRVFDAFIDPLRTRTPSSGRLDAAGACTVLDQLIKVVGKPDSENDPQPGSLHTPLNAKYEQLMKDAEGHLVVMAVTFLEVPQFRLPGAEEAVRHMSARLKQQVETLEPVRNDLDREVRMIYGRLFQSIGTLNTITGLGTLAGRKATTTAEILDLLRLYPRKRLQLHILDMVLSIYRKLAGIAPEYLREINFYRATLADMHALLGEATGSPEDSPGVKLILPEGCANLEETADQFLAGLAPEDLLAFEQALQKEITRKFRGLGHICLKPLEKGPRFRQLLLDRSREFLDTKFDHSDPAEVFFRYRSDETAETLIHEAFREAAPALTADDAYGTPGEINLLAVPPGPAGDRFRELAEGVLAGTDLTPAPLPDDICFYREFPELELVALPQFGEYAREAYQYLIMSDHPPHARLDVPWQTPEL